MQFSSDISNTLTFPEQNYQVTNVIENINRAKNMKLENTNIYLWDIIKINIDISKYRLIQINIKYRFSEKTAILKLKKIPKLK